MTDEKSRHALGTMTLDQIAEVYGKSLGETLPDPAKTHFVLLVFRSGSQEEMDAGRAGIGWSTSSPAPVAVQVVRAFVAMVEEAENAAKNPPGG